MEDEFDKVILYIHRAIICKMIGNREGRLEKNFMLVKKVKDVCKFLVAFIISKIIKINPQKRNLWIITERKAECKDNGYYLFRYLREKHPEVKVYYAIEKDSIQKEKIQNYGNVLNFNSFKHYVYALAAKKLIGAFLPCGVPDSMCFYKFTNLVKGKKIFLQHGITKEPIPSLFYENTRVDLFICGAEPEHKFVQKEFHYPKKNVVCTGFCRFDGLTICEPHKTILLMPTWRKWIPSATWKSEDTIDIEQYEYFHTYKSFIQNKKVEELLYKYGYKMIFFLHHEMQPYMKYFDQLNSRIIFATEKDYDVQELLKTSSCLITDYSSVAFDFAYMKKPVIYFQFDEEEYYSKHYPKGYFSYINDGFGKCCIEEDEVIKELEKIISLGCNMEKCYEDRVEQFFEYRDINNCKRIYEAISDMDVEN